MSHRRFAFLVAVAAVVWLAPAPTFAQSSTGNGTSPRTPDGRPDLHGVWDFRTVTPLERPERWANKEVLTDEDVAEQDAQAREFLVDRAPPSGSVGGYNRFWFDTRSSALDDRRTSLLVDPSDGKLPPLQPEALVQVGSLGEDLPTPRPIRYRVAGAGDDGPEDRGLAERCLLGFNAGPPILPGGYNQNLQLFQTSDYVVILNEMVHDVRIVPLDGRPHLHDDVRQWMGDGRGRWEGDTLVVESTNFTAKTASFSPSAASAHGTGATLRLTERFQRVDADTLLS